MLDLAQLQSEFQSYLIGHKNSTTFTTRIINDAKVGVNRRLAIYFDAYRLRIIEALATAYPKLKALLGDDLFNRIAREYIDDFPSTYQNMRWVGGNMREHLLYSIPEHPIAAEMAVFEWSLSLAFDAEDVAELRLQDLAEIPLEHWNALQLKFQPAIQIVRLRWNIIPIWKALDADEAPPALLQDSIYTSWLIWRRDFSSQFRSMGEMEAIALHMAMTGATFEEVCESLEGQEAETTAEEAMTIAAQYMAGWLQCGMIVSFTLLN
ncbi:MAG: putative DNA-binding domain-containing protein [Bacteroidia bacterium]|nr:putative DNA-binding domain-containing protein [Methylotenera sp.]